jgi:hypothetical protein
VDYDDDAHYALLMLVMMFRSQMDRLKYLSHILQQNNIASEAGGKKFYLGESERDIYSNMPVDSNKMYLQFFEQRTKELDQNSHIAMVKEKDGREIEWRAFRAN